LIVLLYAGLGAIAIAWGALRGDADIYRLRGVSTIYKMAASPMVGLALGLFAVFLSRLATHRFEWARVRHREFHAVVGELSSRELFVLALSSSIGEELFFRGALVPQLGVVLSAAAFALLHVRPAARFLPWTAMSFIVGLVLGQMYMSLGDLGGPMVAHFTINLLNLNYIARTELRA
jgi:membrane protease YdiL (CAAX protease family)